MKKFSAEKTITFTVDVEAPDEDSAFDILEGLDLREWSETDWSDVVVVELFD